MGDNKDELSNSTDASLNENVANQVQKELGFKISRGPANFVIKFGIVTIVLAFLECLLIVSNNFRYFGYWEWFITQSTKYRDTVTSTPFGRTVHLDSKLLDPYSLWRGWIVPSSLAGATYIIVSLLSLRHELYHWKPELLVHYLELSKKSKFGKRIPKTWLDFIFHIYEQKHKKYINKNIQKKPHTALEDSGEFFGVLRVVGFNICLSFSVILIFWSLLLQAGVEAGDIVQLPRSYVPPLQFLLWFLCNDFFYFYPHWIAHHRPSNDLLYFKILPSYMTTALHKHFNQSHKLHHKTKANLGIAAWYCSPWEQLLFNLFPALIGPLLTQILLPPPFNTHLVALYIWLMAASATSVLAHTGFRSCLNDPGKHDLHHERAFNPKTAVNFGTLGLFDWLHGTASDIPKADAMVWKTQRDRQAALWEASRRTGVKLTKEQMQVVKQPDHSQLWEDSKSI